MAEDIVTQLEWLHSEFYDVDSVTSIVELAKAEIERLRTEFSAVLGDAIAKDAENERLRAAGDALAEESWNNRSADKAVKAWWEARLD